MSSLDAGKRRNPLVVMFRAAARPFSYIFPIFLFVTFIMSVLSFRISQPGLEAGFVIVLYVLAVFYLGGMFARKVTLFGLITLFAVPVLLMFISFKTYWPIMIAAMPAIAKAFGDRDLGHIGKVVSVCLGALLLVAFIPASILSCDAYSPDISTVRQVTSPDGRYMLEVWVVNETPMGGRGKAELYAKYPPFLERRERDLAIWQWVPLDTVQRQGFADVHTVGIPLNWKDDHTVVMGDLTMDVHTDPEFIEKD